MLDDDNEKEDDEKDCEEDDNDNEEENDETDYEEDDNDNEEEDDEKDCEEDDDNEEDDKETDYERNDDDNEEDGEGDHKSEIENAVAVKDAKNILDSGNRILENDSKLPWVKLVISSLSSSTVLLHIHDKPKHKGTFWSHFGFQIIILGENLLFVLLAMSLGRDACNEECYIRVKLEYIVLLWCAGAFFQVFKTKSA